MYPAAKTLYELTQTGQVVANRNLSEFALGDLQGMVFAPSGDLTDDPLQMNLYLADRQNGHSQKTIAPADTLESRQSDPAENQIYLPQVTGGFGNGGEQRPGKIVELTFVEPLAVAAAIDFTSSIVNIVDMAQISPPSPDPSGITYVPNLPDSDLPNEDTLMVVDGEVEETVNGIT
jgi:hypothetical protein